MNYDAIVKRIMLQETKDCDCLTCKTHVFFTNHKEFNWDAVRHFENVESFKTPAEKEISIATCGILGDPLTVIILIKLYAEEKNLKIKRKIEDSIYLIANRFNLNSVREMVDRKLINRFSELSNKDARDKLDIR